jgi:thioredoxin-like negative regulator of GroEL
MQVLVIRVDVSANPVLAKTRGVNSAPHVSMMTGETEAFAFQGVWPQEQIERKVEEILRGIKRVGKDWLPEVKGMQPAGKPAKPTPQ